MIKNDVYYVYCSSTGPAELLFMYQHYPNINTTCINIVLPSEQGEILLGKKHDNNIVLLYK